MEREKMAADIFLPTTRPAGTINMVLVPAGRMVGSLN